MARHDQHTFFNEEYQLPKLAIWKERAPPLELVVRNDAALGDLRERVCNDLPGVWLKNQNRAIVES